MQNTNARVLIAKFAMFKKGHNVSQPEVSSKQLHSTTKRSFFPFDKRFRSHGEATQNESYV